MRKICLPIAVILIFALASSAMADPIKTVEKFWSAIFKEGDLKLAYALLATDDQEYIKASNPDVYHFIMGQVSEESGEFGMLFMGLQKVFLTTMGQIVKIDIRDSAQVGVGHLVRYSIALPIDLKFLLNIKTWADQKKAEFAQSGDFSKTMEQLKGMLDEFSAKLKDLNYGTTLSYNSYLTVIKEQDQERILVDFASLQENLLQLKSK